MFIFLDIDGVMVSAQSWKKPIILNDNFYQFIESSISALQSLIDKDTTIILTTSHRFRFNIQEWKEIFSNRNINISKIKMLDKTELNRKDEILNWFNSNSINESFIIIDDDKSLNDLPKFYKDRLILTNSMGLTQGHLNDIK